MNNDSDNDDLEECYQGSCYKIIHCKGAEKSFYNALKHINPNRKNGYKAKMKAFRESLANGKRMSNENFPKEGTLPDGTHFRALKKTPLRAYLWESTKHPKTFFISHYIFKDFQKLKRNDVTKIRDNWRRYEENNDE